MVRELSPRRQSEWGCGQSRCTRPSTASPVTTEKMSENPKRYWMSPARSAGDLENASREIPTIGEVNGDPDFFTTRRSFLKAAGFSFVGAVAASCSRAPAPSAIPYVQQPEQTGPGPAGALRLHVRRLRGALRIARHHRDGRPLKIEGNPDHPLSSGATCAVGQASILGLYDGERLAYPTRRGQRSTWSDVDKEIATSLDRIRQQGGAVRTPDSNDHQSDDFCPHRRIPRQLQECTTRQLRSDIGVGRARRPCADAWRPHSASLPVRSRGRHRFVRCRFSWARGFHPWSTRALTRAGVGLTRRSPSKSYHVQIESRLSLTGSNADQRLRVAPGEIGHLVTHLAARLADRAGMPFETNGLAPSPLEPALDAIAERLRAAQVVGW